MIHRLPSEGKKRKLSRGEGGAQRVRLKKKREMRDCRLTFEKVLLVKNTTASPGKKGRTFHEVKLMEKGEDSPLSVRSKSSKTGTGRGAQA